MKKIFAALCIFAATAATAGPLWEETGDELFRKTLDLEASVITLTNLIAEAKSCDLEDLHLLFQQMDQAVTRCRKVLWLDASSDE